MYSSLTGEAELSSMEDWITLTVRASASGQLDIEGQVTDQPGVGNTLAFSIGDLDQTHLPPAIEALRQVAADFPTVGSP